MNWRFAVLAVVLGTMFVVPPAGAAPATQPAGASPDLFSESKLWTIHIRLSAEAWQQMQPTSRPRFEPRRAPRSRHAPPATTQPQTQPARQKRVVSPYGYEYTRVVGSLQLNDEPATGISIRFKGNLSYSLSASKLRRPMKVEFDRLEPGKRVHGLATMNLNNSVTDPSLLREPLAYAVFRDAGIPAPRTAFALVYLTVDGLHNRECLGLYTIVEEVDRDFLLRHYGDGSGMLLKPEMLRGLPYLGRRWAAYRDRCNPKGKGDKVSRQAFIDLLHLIHFADDATFQQRIGSCIDIDAFLRFLAVQTMIVNFDSFLTTGHNYYLYRNPRDGRFSWMPWDMDLSFGNFVVVAAPPHQMDLSIFRPHVPPNRLIERLLAIAEVDRKYQQHLHRLAAEAFNAARLRQHLSAMEPMVRQAEEAIRVAGRVGNPTTAPAGMPGSPSLHAFIAGRLESVRAQLAGRRDAFVPARSKGLLLAEAWNDHRRGSLVQSATIPLHRAFFPSSVKQVSQADLLAAVRPWLGFLQARHCGLCSQSTLAEILADILPVPPNFVFDPGPGIQWAAIIVRHADANKDGCLSSDELTAAIDQVFRDADANQDGALSEAELQAALIRLASTL